MTQMLNRTSKPVLAAREAMAARFEILLPTGDPIQLHAAAEEALDEVTLLENQLSRHRATSEIAHLNARGAAGPVRLDPRLFQLLRAAQALSRETNGTFDPAVAPLLDCWGITHGDLRLPSDEELRELLPRLGPDQIVLDETTGSVRFAQPGVGIDLGAIGKGYAVDRAVEILKDQGIQSGLVHAGTSSVFAWGKPSEGGAWRIGIPQPDAARRGLTAETLAQAAARGLDHQSAGPLLTTIELHDEALSVSAVWGRSGRVGSRTFGHVLDPRTGHPVSANLMAAVICGSATEADALSTALLVLGPAGTEMLSSGRRGFRGLVVPSALARSQLRTNGARR